VTLSDSTTAWWLETFRPFSAQHLLTVVVCLSVVVGVSLLGRRLRGSAGERGLRLVLASIVLVAQAIAMIWWLLPAQFDPTVSFPLHVCDLIALAAPIAILVQSRPLRSSLYFFGVGLSSQALFTPILDVGLAHTNFWLFWAGHTQILTLGIYDVAARGYRPTARDLRDATLIGLAYVAVILPIDIMFGLNYGFVGRDIPQAPTFISLLPDWPWRVLVIVAAAEVVLIALWLIWPASRWLADWRARSNHKSTRA